MRATLGSGIEGDTLETKDVRILLDEPVLLRLAMNAAFSESTAIVNNRADELPDVVFRPLHDAIVRLVTDKTHVTMSDGTSE